MTDQFTLHWNTFPSHLHSLLADLRETRRHSDVTLVSEDQVKFSVHKFVLTACSRVFSNILDESCKSGEQVIFLRGIEHQEIKSLLQFMYVGEAKFHQDRVDQFLRAAKDLDIKEIRTGVDLIEEEERERRQGIEADREEADEDFLVQNEEAGGKVSEERPTEPLNRVDDILKCPDSDKTFNEKGHLKRHHDAKHKKIQTNKSRECPECGQTFYDSSNMKKHYESKHLQIKHSCDQCDYQATHKNRLQAHIKRVHEGIFVGYKKCEHCDKEFKDLKAHI